MSATTAPNDAGTVTPLVTMPGWLAVDMGDLWPVRVEGQQRALDVLDARSTAKAATPPKP